jgi:hypothetical protein
MATKKRVIIMQFANQEPVSLLEAQQEKRNKRTHHLVLYCSGIGVGSLRSRRNFVLENIIIQYCAGGLQEADTPLSTLSRQAS